MRKTLILTLLTIPIITSSGFILSRQSEAAKSESLSTAEFNLQTPGTRCTRLTYPPRIKARTSKGSGDTGLVVPGTRCTRLTSGPRKGKILPNTAPKAGLSSSTANIGPDASGVVKLQAIACDLDGDNMLYTYSATAGRIQGDGPDAVWDLSGAARPGEYLVTVEVDDGCGCISFTSTQVSVSSVP